MRVIQETSVSLTTRTTPYKKNNENNIKKNKEYVTAVISILSVSRSIRANTHSPYLHPP